MKDKTILISVVVCTYNRASLLKNCLRSLEKQTADKKIYEVIVVNNNSNDNMQEIVKDFAKTRLNIRMEKEENQGLSYARNRGWKEAKGKYIAYIDDDAVANPDWIEQTTIFIKNNPKINAFGGPYDRFSFKPLPAWLPDNYCTLNLGDKAKALNLRDECISGSNMIVNKSIFEKYGGFNTDFGMKGNRILYGEEAEFLGKLNKTEKPVFYVPTICVRHLVAERKLRLWWLLKSDYYHNFSCLLINKGRWDLSENILCLVKSLFMFPLYLLDKKKSPFKRKLYYGLSKIFSSLGRISGSLRRVKSR